MQSATGSKSSPETVIPGGFAPLSRGYRMDGLPPVSEPDRLALEVGLVRAADREDAVQVAWVAHLESADPRLAVKRWWMSLLRQRARERTNREF